MRRAEIFFQKRLISHFGGIFSENRAHFTLFCELRGLD